MIQTQIEDFGHRFDIDSIAEDIKTRAFVNDKCLFEERKRVLECSGCSMKLICKEVK